MNFGNEGLVVWQPTNGYMEEAYGVAGDEVSRDQCSADEAHLPGAPVLWNGHLFSLLSDDPDTESVQFLMDSVEDSVCPVHDLVDAEWDARHCKATVLDEGFFSPFQTVIVSVALSFAALFCSVVGVHLYEVRKGIAPELRWYRGSSPV